MIFTFPGVGFAGSVVASWLVCLYSGFELWPGTLCCVVGEDTLLSQCLSPPKCVNGTSEFNAGG